jgi:hypothetical protein
MSDLSPEILAAFATIPEVSRDVTLRGFQVPHFGISVETFAALVFTDPQLALIAFGVHLEGGVPATAEEVGEARRGIGRGLAAKLVAASTRNQQWADLVPNFTDRELSRSVNTALLLTMGGDTAGFFGDVKTHLELMAELLTAPKSEPTETGKPARSSSKAIQP